MADFYRKLMDSIPNQGQGRGPGLGDNVFAQLHDIDGFPVSTMDFDDDGSLESESNLRSAKRRTLDPDAFEPPSGYKRREMFGGP